MNRQSQVAVFLLGTTLAVAVGPTACSDSDSPSQSSSGAGGAPVGGEAGAAGADGISGAGSSNGGVPSGVGGESSVGAGGMMQSGAGGAAGTATGGLAGSGADGGSDGAAFMLGADISSSQETNLSYRDVDGTEMPLLDVLKNHGFNYVRLKTFVEPNAPYGYASSANGCPGLPEAFGDRDHVVAYGKQIKAAGMGFLLDFHYSDVWADPGNQLIPQAWRGAASVKELAALMKAYTSDVIQTAIDAGARPDMVQIGNEITGGFLKHVPGANTDCWGNEPDDAPFGGSAAKWDDFATLLKAGILGVREVDPTIEIMLHIENTNDLGGVRWWVDSALARSVSFDVLGLSCYVAYQGQPAVWQATLNDLAARYPALKFAIAEYNPQRTRANQIVRALPDGRGVGTFFWEPTRAGSWGAPLFDVQGTTASAKASDFAEFDDLRPQLGL